MKFNLLKRKQKQTTNYEGAKAWTLTPELALYSAVVTASLSNKFYETEKERLDRIKDLIGQCDPAMAREVVGSSPTILRDIAQLDRAPTYVIRLLPFLF